MSGKKKPEKKRSYRPAYPQKKEPTQAAPVDPVSVVGMRLNKFVAHCGICSRRQAADYVKEGKVFVNGKVELSPAYQICEGDRVTFEGKDIQPEEKLVYLLMNKPKGVITTVRDDQGRRTVIDLVGDKVKERIFPVGRLDRDTSGLLVLTNDGALAERMMHPRHKMKKVYHITLDQPVTKAHMEAIGEGLDLEDGPAPVNWVQYLHPDKKKEVGLEIVMGRNRVVRRIFEHLGYTVKKLDRVYLGGLTKKDLPRGWWRHLNEREIIMLKHF
ncbi:MAG: pseudouridine synthase [Saprospiraceae bacterium]